MPKEDKKSKPTEVIGPFEVDEVKRPKSSSKAKKHAIPAVEDAPPAQTVEEDNDNDKKSKKQKKRKDADEPEPEEVATEGSKRRKKNRADSIPDTEAAVVPAEAENEISLGERLESLSKQLSAMESAPASSSKATGEVPTSESMVTLLDQALQSNDEELLEQCLQCANLDVISTTTRHLATHRILILLKKLVAKFERRPSRGLLITQWLAHILKHHLAFLITVPDLAKQLAGLSQMLEQRMQSYTRLSSLAGRLDLLMAQLATTNHHAGEGTDAAHALVPLTVYYEE